MGERKRLIVLYGRRGIGKTASRIRQRLRYEGGKNNRG